MKNPIRRVRPEKTGVRAPLGELELSVMRQVWSCGEQGCQGAEVQRALEREHPLALTTVLTTLERLTEKGILRRQREGKAYVYRAILTEEQLQQRIVEGVLGNLIAQFPDAVAAYLSRQDLIRGDRDRAVLEGLASRVDAMRSLETEGPHDEKPAGERPEDNPRDPSTQ